MYIFVADFCLLPFGMNWFKIVFMLLNIISVFMVLAAYFGSHYNVWRIMCLTASETVNYRKEDI